MEINYELFRKTCNMVINKDAKLNNVVTIQTWLRNIVNVCKTFSFGPMNHVEEIAHQLDWLKC